MAVRMYEREAVVEAIRRLLDAAFAGRGGTVFVVAPAGLGKTSVLQAAATEARGRFDVRMGGGDAVEAALPYGLIGQVLGGEEDGLAVPGAGAEDLPAANRFYVTLRSLMDVA
ncbi:MAG TPA: ATP-binding protein [Streptosporangiaceae bacterium]|nr:ATP-binding protein [Streptosporangiaceae bacterium]